MTRVSIGGDYQKLVVGTPEGIERAKRIARNLPGHEVEYFKAPPGIEISINVGDERSCTENRRSKNLALLDYEYSLVVGSPLWGGVCTSSGFYITDCQDPKEAMDRAQKVLEYNGMSVVTLKPDGSISVTKDKKLPLKQKIQLALHNLTHS